MMMKVMARDNVTTLRSSAAGQRAGGENRPPVNGPWEHGVTREELIELMMWLGVDSFWKWPATEQYLVI